MTGGRPAVSSIFDTSWFLTIVFRFDKHNPTFVQNLIHSIESGLYEWVPPFCLLLKFYRQLLTLLCGKPSLSPFYSFPSIFFLKWKKTLDKKEKYGWKEEIETSGSFYIL